jgi:hypothetical protein
MPGRFLRTFKTPHKSDPSYPSGGYIDPSRYWGGRLGLPSLYPSYSDVFGDRHAELERRLSAHSDKQLLELLLHALRTRYPEIADIPCAGYFEKLNVVRGCTSKFPARDIRYFLEVMDRSIDPIAEAAACIEEKWRKLRIYRSLGYALGWRPSPDTMTLIETRIGLPEWAQAADEFKAAMLMESAAE